MGERWWPEIDWRAPGLANKVAVMAVVATLISAAIPVVFAGWGQKGDKSVAQDGPQVSLSAPPTLPPSQSSSRTQETVPPPVEEVKQPAVKIRKATAAKAAEQSSSARSVNAGVINIINNGHDQITTLNGDVK